MAADTRIIEDDEDVHAGEKLVAIFGKREFWLRPGSDTRAAAIRKEIGLVLRAYEKQRLELKAKTGHPFRIAAAENHLRAIDLLIEAVKAVKSEADLLKPLREAKGGKPGTVVLTKSPWDLMGYIGRYHDEHWTQTKDVTFPDGKPPVADAAKPGADISDAEFDDFEGENLSGEPEADEFGAE